MFVLGQSLSFVYIQLRHNYEYSMTFLPIFGNIRKMCALDCGTITFMNENQSQFLDSLMDKRLSFALKRCVFESSSISFFSSFSS